MNARDEVIDWLKDAYAMERGLEVTLKKQSESDDYEAQIRSAAARHLEDTRRHARMVESLLKSLGSNTSTVKTGMGIMTESMKGFGTSMARDERIKDLLASYAMEHFEIACYKALVVAAERAHLTEVSETCNQIIDDEELMARTLDDALPMTVQNYLSGTMAKAA